MVVLGIYVDKIIIASKTKSVLVKIINGIIHKWELTYKFDVEKFLGMNITVNEYLIAISQFSLINGLITQFPLKSEMTVSTPIDTNY